MNNKRFTMEYSYLEGEYVYYDNGKALTPSEVLKLLNEMVDNQKEKRGK